MRKINRPECPNSEALHTDYTNPVNKQALISASFGKCMYCESKITHIDYGDIEHIKPKSKFPELEFERCNLGYACIKCNRKYKRDIYHEEDLLINPYEENPETYIISHGALLYAKIGAEKGEITINNIGLNRCDLIEKRQEKINQIDKAIKSCFRTSNVTLKESALEELVKEAHEDKEYSLCVKYLLQNHELLE